MAFEGILGPKNQIGGPRLVWVGPYGLRRIWDKGGSTVYSSLFVFPLQHPWFHMSGVVADSFESLGSGYSTSETSKIIFDLFFSDPRISLWLTLYLVNFSDFLVPKTRSRIWRMQRRLFSKYLHPAKTEIHEPRVVEHTYILLGKLLERPEGFLSHIRHFHRVAKKGRVESKEALTIPFTASIAAIRDGTIFPSFVSKGMADSSLPRNVDPAQHQRILQEISGKTYLAAVDTTYGSIGVFILAMMKYPEIQKTAQRELDEVVQGRLPEYSDVSSLPYIAALLGEVLRHDNYPQPKPNVSRAMLHDEHEYPNPQTFKPEHFLKDGRLNEDIRNPEDIAFGFGRRKCPGQHIARSTLWLSTASILSTFDIEKPVDENGHVVEPTYEIVSYL
ncbi:cytochrome P450 [Cyathus striatus]|nr:cytochrome P450 [Cyathus striatus]